VEAFAGARRVVVPDLLWFGGSSSTERDYSLEHQVRTLAALLDALGERQVDVVGISYGGFAAYELAARHPERVRRLVLVDSPGCAYTRADYDALLQRFGVARPADLFLPADEAGVARLLDLAYADPPWAPSFARRQALAELYSRWREEKEHLLEALVQSMAVRADCSVAPRLPTLIVWGRGDEVFPLALGQRLAASLGPTARLVVIDRARHAPNLEHPRQFNELLRDFLDGGARQQQPQQR
jgi:pimeloyl-ACP methyl ester carboxylesterase